MGKPLSTDLRARALVAVCSGMSRRAAAKRFGVGVSSVIRWDAARRSTGHFAPMAQGGDMRSRRLDARGTEVMAALEEERDQTLVELCGRLAARGIATSKSALSRFTDAGEPVLVPAFLAVSPVEAFDVSVLGRLARVDEIQLDA